MGKLKAIPKFKTEAEERRFWELQDSSNYIDWGNARRAALPNLKPSTKTISLRLPESLLENTKIEVNKRDMPYQFLLAEDVRQLRESDPHSSHS